MTEIRTVAVVGAGRAGLQHARAAELNGVRVVAHASRGVDSERSRAFRREFPESKPFSMDDVSICEQADLVVLSVPPDVTHRVAPGFIRASRRILIEKPAALTTHRIRELVQAERESGCDVVVGYNRRCYPLVAEICDVLRADPPTQVNVAIVEDMSYVRSSKSSDLQSSYLRHGSATHFLDLVQFLVGPFSVREIRASKSQCDESFVDLAIRAFGESGVSINISIDADDRSRRGLEISTVGGCRIHLSPLENLSIAYSPPPKDASATESSKSLESPNSYTDSFVRQFRKVVKGDTSALHRLNDSLRLSIVVDELELASSAIRND